MTHRGLAELTVAVSGREVSLRMRCVSGVTYEERRLIYSYTLPFTGFKGHLNAQWSRIPGRGLGLWSPFS